VLGIFDYCRNFDISLFEEIIERNTDRIISTEKKGRDRDGRISRNRHRHFRHQDPGHRRARQDPRRRNGNLPALSSQAPLERAGPGGLVASDRQVGSPRREGRQAQAGRRQGHRPVRPDARFRLPRQKQQSNSPRPVVERPADRRRVPRNRRASRRPPRVDQARLESRDDRLHRAEDSLAAKS